ncbi:MAG: TetR/AcrR family transcriptional regulator [Planctomycetes bacterium]|nr:TetR/AcrR family transcriptional regulator [Planctomycetota bacterium]
MPRRSLSHEKRREFLPILAKAFAELSYRRTTTAELARRCDVRENILYRLWPDKKAMFIAAIDYVFDLSAKTWGAILAECKTPAEGASRLLEYEARHHGEFGHHRIVFAGLSETDDPEIRAALRRMFGRFQRFLANQIETSRGRKSSKSAAEPAMIAWAMLGLGTAANISRELDLLTGAQRRRLIGQMGELLLSHSAA